MLPEDQELANLLARKEQEWKELQQRQILSLQKSLREVQTNLQEQKEKFERLKKDFMYNLKVLAERDTELQECRVMFGRLKAVENLKQAEISDLRVQITKLQQELQREHNNLSDLQTHHQQGIMELQMEMENLNSSKNSTIVRLMEEYENVKRQLERKIEEVRGDLNRQRQELSLEYDNEIQRREHTHRICLDELNNLVMAHELKVKFLTNELEIKNEMASKSAERLQKAESASESLQEALRQKDFEMNDLLAVKEARIKELDGNVQTLLHQIERQEKNFQQKHEQLDRCAREKESALRMMKQAHNEQIQELESQRKELQMCVETLKMEQNRTECNHKAELAEKDNTIAKLENDVKTVKSGWDSYIIQVSQETVNKDLLIQSLQEKEDKQNAQIAKYQKDVERYQQQLADSVERERLFEQARVQVELDWQKRCEDIEKTQYQKSEELIEGLSKAKDRMEAELKEKDRKINELQLVVTTVTLERDRAVTTVKKQGVPNNTDEQVQGDMPEFASKEIQTLQEQNSELRQVISQMRKEMEMLCEQISPAAPEPTEPPTGDTNKTSPSADYVKYLEEEIKGLKQKCRELEEQRELTQASEDSLDLPSTSKPVLPDNVYMQNHIKSLNETIGALRADKVASAAAAKRLEAGAAHLESMVAELTQKVHQKQVEIDQLKFQLTNETRHNQATMSSLQIRQSELELQLSEARKEAEEYFKSNLKQNLETAGLGDESETVRQLREEILTLQQQLVSLRASGDGPTSILKKKLKEATQKISQLNMEKQQLIEKENRLRAELEEDNAPTTSKNVAAETPKSPNRLSKLESLQYQLTSQELQFAQYQKTPRVSANGHPDPKAKPQWHSDSSAMQPPKAKSTQKENLSPSPRQHHVNSARSLRSEALLTEDDTAYEEVWKVLELGSSVSLLSSQEETEQVFHAKNEKKAPSTGKTAQPANSKRTKTPKIRNYNIKD